MKLLAQPWPCSACGASGVKNLGTLGYCVAHLTAFLHTVSPEAWIAEGGGVGLPALARPDIAPGYYEQTCATCGAGWVGAAFERCRWCAQAIEWMRTGAAERLVEPPDVEPDDLRYGERMEAWAGRLARGVKAGIITEAKAQWAWTREVSRAS